MNIWWAAGLGVFVGWTAYTLYRTGYRDGWSDGRDGRPQRRW